MAQFWLSSGKSEQRLFNDGDNAVREPDDTLQLKVRCRHSMSLVFDSIWHWREEYEARGRGTLDGKSRRTYLFYWHDIDTNTLPSFETNAPRFRE